MKERKRENLAGQKFGELTVIRDTCERNGGHIIYKCRCSCGNTSYSQACHLNSGHTKSCGCLSRKKLTERNKVLIRAGTKNHNWGGGTKKSDDGRTSIKYLGHPFASKQGYVLKYRLVLEQHLGRFLLPKEVVHHIDSDCMNNKLSNLMLFNSQAEHLKFHALKKG